MVQLLNAGCAQDAAQVALLRQVLHLLHCHPDPGNGAAGQLPGGAAMEPLVWAVHVRALLRLFQCPQRVQQLHSRYLHFDNGLSCVQEQIMQPAYALLCAMDLLIGIFVATPCNAISCTLNAKQQPPQQPLGMHATSGVLL
jgi:hypothetical protein